MIAGRRSNHRAYYNPRRSVMSRKVILAAVFEREDDVYVAICPELSIASHGESLDEARKNLIEALEGWFETASETEIEDSIPSEVHIEKLELAVG
jgi:predicted RNase H-like HicB family nuclease